MAIKLRTPNTNIQAGSINTNFLKDDAVTTDKIADDAVTLAKISTSGASNDQVLQYNSTSGEVEWGDAGTSSFDPANAGAIANTTTINPAANNTYDIGGPTLKYNDIYAETFQGTAVLAGTLTTPGTAGDILTYQDSSNKWLSSETNTVGQFKLDGSSGGVTAPILKLITDNTGWNRPQMILEDSNDDVVAIVGQNSTTGSRYQYNFTLDPNNTKPRTNVGGNGGTYAGDYFVSFNKKYADQDNIKMSMDVYGANDGFEIEVRDDANGTNFSGDGLGYNWKPIVLKGSEISLRPGVGLTTPVEQVKIERYRTTISGNLKLHVASSDPTDVAASAGDLYFNNSTNPGKVKVYNGTAWENLH